MKNTKSTGHTALVMGDIKKKYRVIIQQRKTKEHPKEKARSFMLYDYTGESDIDAVKKKLETKIMRFKK